MPSYFDPSSITHLTAERYETAKDKAKALIEKRDPRPDADKYMHSQSTSKYPWWLRAGIMVGLVLAMLIGFYISAGKLIVESDLVSSATTHHSVWLTVWRNRINRCNGCPRCH